MNINNFKQLDRIELKSIYGGIGGDCYATNGCSSGCARDGICSSCCIASASTTGN